MKIPKSVFCITIFLLLYTYILSASENEGPDGSSFLVRAKDNHLTIKVNYVPLEEVLREIVNQTSIRIVLYGPAEELVSADFSGLPLAKGLKRLTRNFGHALIYRPETAKRAKPEIKAMLIFPRAGERSKKALESRVIAPEKRTSQELGEASLDSLIEALQDKNAEVREEAVDRLAELKDKGTIIHLIGVLSNDRDPDIRESAAEALGDLGGPEAIDALIEALEDRNAEVRESAVESLGEIGGDEAVHPLMDALKDGDEDVREAAAIVLRQITGEKFGPD